MTTWNRLDKREKKIVAVLVIILFISLYLLQVVENFDEHHNDSPPIGRIITKEKDTRLKSSSSFAWKIARGGQNIYTGDSLFTGESSTAQIDLNEGGQLNLGQMSIVIFSQVNKEKVADLVSGNFSMKVNGKMKVAIQGELLTVEGSQAEVQIFTGSDNKPQIKLVKGSAKVLSSGQEAIQLKSWQTTSLKPDMKRRGIAQAVPTLPESEPPVLAPTAEILRYTWKLYDLYEHTDSISLARKEIPKAVPQEVLTSWSTVRYWKISPMNFVEISANANFNDSHQFKSDTNSLKLPEAYLGTNFWRVSHDAKHWSPAQKFEVTAQTLQNAKPQIVKFPNKVVMSDATSTTTISILLKVPFEPLGYVAEASTSTHFEAENSRTFWSAKKDLRLSFYKPGKYYYRFRAADQEQQLTEWSAAHMIEVVAPQPMINLRVAQEQKVKKQVALPKPQKAPASIVDSVPFEKVESSPTSAVSAMPLPRIERLNSHFVNSRIALEGAAWTLQSTEQEFTGAETPIATGIGLRAQHWFGSHGFEGSFKTGVFGVNPSGSRLAPKQTELRYHYRFLPDLFDREIQTTLFVGYEMYRSAGTGSFAPQYDLVKLGTSLEIPLGERWTGGGEILYGHGLDKSKKQEISGHFNYFLDKNWAFGVGYRIHLFEAGSLSSSAGYLPYREGYTEGYSSLLFHY